MKKYFSHRALLASMLLVAGCTQIYNPPPTKGNHGFLVVGGFLHVGQDSTIISLSRSQNLRDSDNQLIPELHAQLRVVGSADDAYTLQEEGNGLYVTSQLNLNYNETYMLNIVTSNGKQYVSDPIAPKQSPPIDTITWHADSTGMNIYLNTHDPAGNTRYYLWDFTETWERHASFTSLLDYVNGQMIQRPSSNQIYACWKTQNSSSILVNTSAKLSADEIYQQPIQFIPMGAEQLFILYSIDVRQYAISPQSYIYWQNLKSSTELTGSVFDPVLNQASGNMRCVTDPSEPVFGFVSASTVNQKRIFINRYDFSYWFHYPPDCKPFPVGFGDASAFADSAALTPLSEIQSGINASSAACGDCRVTGGVNSKPSFWP